MTYGRKFDEGEEEDADDDGGSVDSGSDAEINEID